MHSAKPIKARTSKAGGKALDKVGVMPKALNLNIIANASPAITNAN